MSNEEKMQQEFEEWYQSAHRVKTPNGGEALVYLTHWDAWKACYALRARDAARIAELERKVTMLRDELSAYQMYTPTMNATQSTADAFEAKVKAEAELERDKAFCEAIIATQTSDSGRLTCDVQKLLEYYNGKKAELRAKGDE